MTQKLSRRKLLAIAGISAGAVALAAGTALQQAMKGDGMVTLYTFGDSILDCGHYNTYGLTPGQLLVQNDDKLFPEFHRLDLVSHIPATLVHLAQDGATVSSLPAQVRGLQATGRAVAIMTIGGNDLLRGLAWDRGPGIQAFRAGLDTFLDRLPIRPVLLGTVYDPSFRNDANNPFGLDPALARPNHARVNDIIAEMGQKYGAMVDLHAHFLHGDPSWFTHTIEPSAIGASEIRRVFLSPVLSAFLE